MGGLGTLKAYILKPVTEVTLPFATRGERIRFDPMPNDYWKISQGTSEDSEKATSLDVDLVSGDEFDLIERVKEIYGTPALERKIYLHRKWPNLRPLQPKLGRTLPAREPQHPHKTGRYSKERRNGFVWRNC